MLHGITVTKPSLPPLEEYVELVRTVWDSQYKQGSLPRRLGEGAGQYLGVPYVSLFCNGMIALQVGLQALKMTGEVIINPLASRQPRTHSIGTTARSA